MMKVSFLCAGNCCRSQMAHGFARGLDFCARLVGAMPDNIPGGGP